MIKQYIKRLINEVAEDVYKGNTAMGAMPEAPLPMEDPYMVTMQVARIDNGYIVITAPPREMTQLSHTHNIKRHFCKDEKEIAEYIISMEAQKKMGINQPSDNQADASAYIMRAPSNLQTTLVAVGKPKST